MTKDIEVAAKRIEKSINGPMGKEIDASLDEGESFIPQMDGRSFRITKQQGRLIVTPLVYSSD
ncbi:MAG: hypothetical protein ACXABV_12445 [Candidatus Thorarchaeota archaeon]|jgi:hypothetical protein